ncbi:hypothetical protein A3K92_03635 [Thermococcus gorgonarius]|uniref:Uncharacterized protein n=1 Tax=Thermococcus gorgonarius TaxID=71997 RepID=A0A2Z2M476_THEGO|nr:hypothetical protein A3K92_03635 [Thermococcus gorgonarius]
MDKIVLFPNLCIEKEDERRPFRGFRGTSGEIGRTISPLVAEKRKILLKNGLRIFTLHKGNQMNVL